MGCDVACVVKEDSRKAAKKVVRDAMRAASISYRQLCDGIEKRGVFTNEVALMRKISHGGFSFAFMLFVLDVIKEIGLEQS